MKVKQRQAELQQLQDERKRIADALDEVEEKENEEESRIQRELLKMHTEAEIHVVEHDVSLDEEESRAWAELKALFEKLRKPHTYEQLSEKRELRNSLWKQYSCACERAQRNLMVARDLSSSRARGMSKDR
mmetsp:Transcript_10506/g.39647  ORF Transcript_10506/g.39647 Transcript_10506/m.39647 type:complete len:131 (-) Transcript_10506:192-584(-)